ncbi:MAG: spore germination protein [Clostridia bacterium]|nr:spore germination protein [Clostridia bacterium]
MLKYQFFKEFCGFADLKTRQLRVQGQVVDMCFLDGMVNSDKVAEYVAKPILSLDKKPTFDNCMQAILFGAECIEIDDVQSAKKEFLDGKTILFFCCDERAIAVDTKGIEYRAVIEPPTNMVTKGPREGFNENVKTNVMLLRKRLKTSDFRIKYLSVGDKTNTMVAVCWLKGVANKKITKQIISKIENISIDGVIDSSYIACYLDPDKTNLFRMVGSIEKPDIVCSKLLEGRVAIVVDGSPIVLTLPYMFIEDMQSPDDYYYYMPQMATAARVLRLIAMTIAVLLPGVYVAMQVFHYQMLPSKFLITIVSATQGIPFTPLIEMIVVILLFDILREANSRMPQIAGLSLSIVGAIILGDAAVKAGLLGAPAVMIGAMSGIGLYTMPDNTMLFMLMRIAFTLLGGYVGILGILLGVMLVVSYVVSLDQFGTPYLAPIAPSIANDKMDALFKKPLQDLQKRDVSAMSIRGKD